MKVKLTKYEFDFLIGEMSLSEDIKNIFSDNYSRTGKLVFTVNDEIVDEIRDCCGDLLQEIGFDENYELNKYGEILEAMIDKFYLQ